MLIHQRFSWDPRKNRVNIVKHHISFSRAAKIFDGPRLEKKTPVETMAKNGCLPWAEVKDEFFALSIHGALMHPYHFSQKGEHP